MVCLVLLYFPAQISRGFFYEIHKKYYIRNAYICNKPANKLDKFKVLWAILAQAVNNL